MGGKLWIVLGVLVVGGIATTVILTASHHGAKQTQPVMSPQPSAVSHSQGRVALVKQTPTPTASASSGGSSGGGGTQSAPAPLNNGNVSTQQGGFSGGENGSS